MTDVTARQNVTVWTSGMLQPKGTNAHGVRKDDAYEVARKPVQHKTSD